MSRETEEANRFSFKNKLSIVYVARFVRAFCFAAVSVIFALFLLERGFSSVEIGSIISATLIEDAVLTALVSVCAERIGLRPLLLVASLVFTISGLLFAFSSHRWVIVLAAVFGIISPAGYEGGPFGAVEQAIVSESAEGDKLAKEFSIYNLVAFAGSALGSAITGFVFPMIKQNASSQAAYSIIFLGYAFGGLLMLLLYLALTTDQQRRRDRSKIESPSVSGHSTIASSETEIGSPHEELPPKKLSAIKSPIIWRLSFLQGVDAFGGGFIPTTLISYWFFERFHAGPEFTGPVFALTYALAAASFVLAPLVCKRFGLLNTMVFTHLPCSMALCAIPFMPTAFLAGGILVARSLFSSMDIPARQAYSMMLVAKEDRTAVAGLTSASRSIGQCAAPLISGWALANTLSGMSFQIAGALKTFYDVCIYIAFRDVPLHKEDGSSSS